MYPQKLKMRFRKKKVSPLQEFTRQQCFHASATSPDDSVRTTTSPKGTELNDACRKVQVSQHSCNATVMAFTINYLHGCKGSTNSALQKNSSNHRRNYTDYNHCQVANHFSFPSKRSEKQPKPKFFVSSLRSGTRNHNTQISRILLSKSARPCWGFLGHKTVFRHLKICHVEDE